MVLGEVVCVGAAEGGEDAEEIEEGGGGEGGEDAPLEGAGLEEDGGVAEGAEPEQVNPVGEQGAAGEDEDEDGGEQDEDCAAARTDGLCGDGANYVFGQVVPLGGLSLLREIVERGRSG